jgi:hypothetical protein
MKINELFEQQQDEGIGSTLGKVAGGIGKAVGGAVGGARAIGSAAKAGYKAGSAGAQQSILGQTFPGVSLNPNGQAPAGQQGNAPAQGQQQTAPAQQGDAPVQGQQEPAAPTQQTGLNWDTKTGLPISDKAKAQYDQMSPEQKAERASIAQAAAQGQQAPAQAKVEPTMDPAQGQQAPAAEEPPKATAMKGDQIAGELKGVWDKASADQGSMTGSPQVQQQIIAMAKAAGLAGRKIEGKQFYSKFLGKDI